MLTRKAQLTDVFHFIEELWNFYAVKDDYRHVLNHFIIKIAAASLNVCTLQSQFIELYLVSYNCWCTRQQQCQSRGSYFLSVWSTRLSDRSDVRDSEGVHCPMYSVFIYRVSWNKTINTSADIVMICMFFWLWKVTTIHKSVRFSVQHLSSSFSQVAHFSSKRYWIF
mgnify:CR=1 FL=1